MNTYVVRVGFDTRDIKKLKIIEPQQGIANIGADHQFLYVERELIGADPLEFDLQTIKTTNLQANIIVLKEQAIYIVPMEKGDYLETENLKSISIKTITPLD
ncbi:MAG TPA: hypothetical protein DCX54_04175 [Flavobacteriales bacterium]|nr:hypothetical protein [Flavobacteriales bacterium]